MMAAMLFRDIPYETRVLRATEARLEAIYAAAHAGLKGDSLALAAGMRPDEWRRLQQFDPIAEMAELKGRADSEMEAAQVINAAIAGPDIALAAKMAVEKLRYQHAWVAKQQIDVTVDQQISITGALEEARRRVIDARWSDVDDVAQIEDATVTDVTTVTDADA